MALTKLQITIEKEGSVKKGPRGEELPAFEKDSWISALFNPNKLVFNKSVNWAKQDPAGCDVPELHFTNAQPRTLNLDLIFDTYDTPNAEKKDVRNYTQKLFQLTSVDGKKHRPPVCQLSWGVARMFFQCVLQQLEQQFTLFMEDGKPVRATARCTFQEWRTNYEGLNRQDRQSSDIAKTWVVKRGETLSSIAAEEYRDPSLWRPIAAENEIDDPLSLAPGTVLLIPTLTQRNATDRYSS
jgi:nucleoid-associated protein YgaU